MSIEKLFEQLEKRQDLFTQQDQRMSSISRFKIWIEPTQIKN